MQNTPLIIGHRGSSAVSPENTLAAFAQSFDDGADGIELDVRLARDGVPVVIHDGNLRHTAGVNQLVENLTSAELGETDVAARFYRAHRALPRPEHPRRTIPTLDEVFQFLRDRKRKNFVAYVEIKTGRSSVRNSDLAGAVVELIKRHGISDQTIVISFNLATVARIKQLDSSVRTGALFSPRQKGLRPTARIFKAAIDCGAQEILFHRLLSTRGMIARARERDLTPVVWTVDDVKWLSRAERHGIHAIMTNNPGLMIAERRTLRSL